MDRPARSALEALSATLTDVVQAPAVEDRLTAVSLATTPALPMTGSAITLMSSDAARITLGASDLAVAELEQVQYDLGEGPSLTAFTTGRPVLLPDLGQGSAATRWPVLLGALDPVVRALFAFPLRFGAITLGVAVGYRNTPGTLTRDELAFVLAALDLTTMALLEVREGGDAGRADHGWLLGAGGQARNRVHQATGMVMAQMQVTAEAAFALLRGHAFATSTGLEQVAAQVVNRQLRMDETVD